MKTWDVINHMSWWDSTGDVFFIVWGNLPSPSLASLSDSGLPTSIRTSCETLAWSGVGCRPSIPPCCSRWSWRSVWPWSGAASSTPSRPQVMMRGARAQLQPSVTAWSSRFIFISVQGNSVTFSVACFHFIYFFSKLSFQQIKSNNMIKSKRRLVEREKDLEKLLLTCSRSGSPVGMIQVQTTLLIPPEATGLSILNTTIQSHKYIQWQASNERQIINE